MAAAGDFDGDGRVELLPPDVRFTTLAAICRTGVGAEVAWTASVGARTTTNLATPQLPGEGPTVGGGLEGGVLRVWVP